MSNRSGPVPWRAPALWWSAIVVAGIILGSVARSPMEAIGRGRMFPRLPGPPPDLPTLLFLLGVGSVVWYVALLALPLLLWAARHVPAERHARGRAIVAAAASVIGLFLLTAVVDLLVTYRGAPSMPGFASFLPQAIRQDFLPFVALVGVVAAVESRRRAREAALERERLRAVIAEQRLVALTTQLQPHFLFNTLQGISTLLHRDPDAADEMLAKLSDLLRELLRNRERALVPLGEELRFARLFLDIAQIRFADRLTTMIEVPTELQVTLVPLFLLQPLIENALSHGIGRKAAGGCVSVRAVRQGERLVIDVADDGAGVADQAAEGMGLSNTRERLRAAFSSEQSLELLPRPGGGTTTRVSLPYTTGA